ncbi:MULTISPECIES: response regulator transcription factor [unclassified Undibacterium]|uniref:response regulator transcription factor n=1 Tax=unclassified Undibacterium TaxID=2630295 RepID=UPI002AC951E2|nr:MULTISPECIES: response regulator transcription factor [unclassified Undibacterium]MEB0140927.1 response regulator transcription factor [Undibacterium sp. CCC2.1]MEB0173156.1 response regulator transcription factor [Undibacterium sp. CCC1.1]MEB0177878.1 response regulator transcription factor [Undibacterium sp. CCC3.4]MEB0216137.1 response regulator transcription factor [Undibacterium sp. 5I2]WPX42814.1 response regulator transcription factor [Undibacterium sp. CCC3.4]
MSRTRVLLVDDHTMLREALGFMLSKETGLEVVGELGDGSRIEEVITQLQPDVVVMDVSMPNMNGIDATRKILRLAPHTGVVALSAFGYKQFIVEMMSAGALAYVVKSAASEQLRRAIASVAQGHVYLCPESAAMMVALACADESSLLNHVPEGHLGKREREVLRLICQGKSSPEIGSELHIAISTVEVHRRNIMGKLDIHSVAELTKYAIRRGLTHI